MVHFFLVLLLPNPLLHQTLLKVGIGDIYPCSSKLLVEFLRTHLNSELLQGFLCFYVFTQLLNVLSKEDRLVESDSNVNLLAPFEEFTLLSHLVFFEEEVLISR